MNPLNSHTTFPANGEEAAQMATTTIRNSWDLFTLSWRLLWKQAFFPIVALLVSASGSILFARFVYQIGIVQAIIQQTHRVGNTNTFTMDKLTAEQIHQIVVVIGLLVGFLLMMHVFNFFVKAALAASTYAHLTGARNGLAAGLIAPVRHFLPILGWLIVSGTVGFVGGLRSTNGNGNPGEGIATTVSQGILDAAWKVITFLTVPIIVVEKVGPISAIKRSTHLVRATWGQQLVGKYGIGSIVGTFTGALFVVIVGLGGGLAYLTHTPLIALIFALLLIGTLVCIGAMSSALVTIYQTVLYQYAQKGSIPEYAPQAFQSVFSAR
jgi:hypothetical protein